MKLLCILLVPLLSFPAMGQLIIKEKGVNNDVVSLVKKQFVGDGIRVVKVSYRGHNEAIGHFTDEQQQTGFSSGLVMGTGRVELIAGRNTKPNMSSNFGDHFFFDEDLVTKASQCDGAVLQIDFIPSRDSICFAFLFGSEEYPEFVGKEFNDMFQLLLKPLFIKAPYKNLGQLPDKKMLNINNINHLKNPSLYIDNTHPANPFYNLLEFDGFTRPMNVGSRVVPGKLYRLKIMIIDLEDCEYDSGVLFQAYSMRSVSSKPKLFKPVKKTVHYHFTSGSSELVPKELSKLKKLTDSLSRFIFDSIVVTGYTDNNGTDESNLVLSAQRAQTIVRYFKEHGVKCSSFESKGEGAANPIALNNDKAGQAQNRRVEIIFYRKPE